MRLYVQKQRTFRQIIIKNATTDYQQHDTTDPDGAEAHSNDTRYDSEEEDESDDVIDMTGDDETGDCDHYPRIGGDAEDEAPQDDERSIDGADEVSDSDNRSWQSSESGEKESDIESSDEEYASSSDDAGEEE